MATPSRIYEPKPKAAPVVTLPPRGAAVKVAPPRAPAAAPKPAARPASKPVAGKPKAAPAPARPAATKAPKAPRVKPTAQEAQAKAGIAARSQAKYGRAPRQAAVDATYQRNVARGVLTKTVGGKPSKPSVRERGGGRAFLLAEEAPPTPDYGEQAYEAARAAAAAGGGTGGYDRWAGLTPGTTDAGGRRVVGPGENYMGPGEKPWTREAARAWWDNWFAQPYNLAGMSPQNLPGSLVLSPEETARARQINTRLGPRPSDASGQNPGYRPGDTSINNSYDLLAYLAQLEQQKAAGTYAMANDPSRRSGSDAMAQAELERNIAVAKANIAQNKQEYARQLAAAGPLEGMAKGGRVKAGRAYRVGERGTETFVPDTDGRIVPHTKPRVSLPAKGRPVGRGVRAMQNDAGKRRTVVPIRPKTPPGKPALTGKPNALTRGQGKQVGLTSVGAAPGTPAPTGKPNALTRGQGKQVGLTSVGAAPGTPAPLSRGPKPPKVPQRQPEERRAMKVPTPKLAPRAARPPERRGY